MARDGAEGTAVTDCTVPPNENVIELVPAEERLPIELATFRRHCNHLHVIVDCETREVRCRCGALVDPFEYMITLAERWRNDRAVVRSLVAEKARLNEEIAALKPIVAGLRASVRRGQKRIDRG